MFNHFDQATSHYIIITYTQPNQNTPQLSYEKEIFNEPNQCIVLGGRGDDGTRRCYSLGLFTPSFRLSVYLTVRLSVCPPICPSSCANLTLKHSRMSVLELSGNCSENNTANNFCNRIQHACLLAHTHKHTVIYMECT